MVREGYSLPPPLDPPFLQTRPVTYRLQPAVSLVDSTGRVTPHCSPLGPRPHRFVGQAGGLIRALAARRAVLGLLPPSSAHAASYQLRLKEAAP